MLALNLLLYKIGWTTGVLSASAGHPGVGMAIILALITAHCLLVPEWRGELVLILQCGALGLVVDSVQTATGILTFPPEQSPGWIAPAWIVAMWMQMGTTLRFCLRFLQGRYLMAAALGAVGGPFSFFAGERMGAVVLHSNPIIAAASLGLVWVVVMPLMTWMASRPASLLQVATYQASRLRVV